MRRVNNKQTKRSNILVVQSMSFSLLLINLLSFSFWADFSSKIVF